MKELEAIYRKRKHQLLPLIFGLASFFVVFRVIMPQWSDIQDIQELLTTKSAQVEAKQSSVTTLNSISQQVVDDNYTTVTTALPLQKDIVLIFNELNGASTRANVKLGGFNLKVGGIYTNSKTVKPTERAVSGIPNLDILVNVSGPNANLRQFAEELYKSVPLVEIKSVDMSKTEARLDVNFFYKPIALKPSNADTTVLKNLSSAEVTEINTLKSWQVLNPSQ